MLWDLLYRAAYDLALSDRDATRAVDLLLDLGGLDRSGFEAARLHYVGHLSGAHDATAERAVRYLELALCIGDGRHRWQASAESIDPWDFARHRVAAVA